MIDSSVMSRPHRKKPPVQYVRCEMEGCGTVLAHPRYLQVCHSNCSGRHSDDEAHKLFWDWVVHEQGWGQFQFRISSMHAIEFQFHFLNWVLKWNWPQHWWIFSFFPPSFISLWLSFSCNSQHHIKYQHLLKKKFVCPHPSCGRLFRLQKQLLRHAKHHTGKHTERSTDTHTEYYI